LYKKNGINEIILLTKIFETSRNSRISRKIDFLKIKRVFPGVAWQYLQVHPIFDNK
jgi:hypothetical protein